MTDTKCGFDNLDVHVYPIFRVKLTGMKGTPKEVAEAAEFAIGAKLNECGGLNIGKVHGELLSVEFADGFDAALVDVMSQKRRLESFTVSEMRDTALQHAETLNSQIDGADDDDLGRTVDDYAAMLIPIRDFLRTIK